MNDRKTEENKKREKKKICATFTVPALKIDWKTFSTYIFLIHICSIAWRAHDTIDRRVPATCDLPKNSSDTREWIVRNRVWRGEKKFHEKRKNYTHYRRFVSWNCIIAHKMRNPPNNYLFTKGTCALAHSGRLLITSCEWNGNDMKSIIAWIHCCLRSWTSRNWLLLSVESISPKLVHLFCAVSQTLKSKPVSRFTVANSALNWLF